MRNKKSFPNRIYRAFKLNFLRLFRTPGGVKKISLGFSIGFGLEMIVISTACLVYLIFYPVVKMAGGSIPAAIIGNVVGKLTFLPIILMPFAKKLGEWIYPSSSGSATVKEASILDIFQGNFEAVKAILHGGLHILIGMTIFGILSAFISYYVIQFFHNRNHKRRQAKRRRKRMLVSETVSS
ncbi:DUF2062 domain-containing protein [Paenibacillus pinistramenti]|uniref:DUF2062 domain-containing protein n=1 Tax=Paenibacillus pinistramenti TaxID=1768003 RepID=UPI001109F9B7|nr:DUF2062 domain-containing protein [Paenibacillus pinistramenti]